ncbi:MULTISPECIES: MFS transporter [Micromonospora]|uniref:MFS transporter n=1 Tax=Micromonospora solifontis TaxID=2487138 RepID=A0ABX9WBC5_9ACTN|nr:MULTISPECIES: MFS transporter [Micromonospora]NES16490.1 MFS transporter [Micromonospora sp. PPF5-17B]NES38725.1 MFS transporter [Micromonospora solifontis]NES58178.1 MFS transporter [Micromonospora sp. PPF5-6]RNL93958.1 MFS transporter [Micromonospora solifontis]
MLRRALPARPEARRILLGTLLSAVGRGLTLPFLFIYLTDVRGLSDNQAGLVIGWFGAVTLALSPLGGTLIDRFGARRVVLPCLAVEALGTASLGLVHSVGTAFAVSTLIAVGGSALWSGQSTILASLTDEGERQRVFGLQFALLNLGIGVGGLISGAVVDVARPVTFQAIYLLDAASYLTPGLILLTLPHVGHRLVQARAAGAARASGGYLTVLRDRPFRRLVLFGLVLTTCGYAQIEVGFTAYSVRVVEVTPRVVAWALACNTVMIVLSQLLVIRRMEGRSRTGALAAVGGVFATAWLVLGAAGVIGTGNALLAALGVVACSAIFGFGETMLSPVMPALTNALATDELRGRYNAMSSMIFGISGIIGPVTAGPLLGAAHGKVWVAFVVGGCLIASVLALSLRRLLTPAQDGRATPVAVPDPQPVAA